VAGVGFCQLLDMPCIAIGPEDEEEEEAPSRIVWATSCAAGGDYEEVSHGSAEDKEETATATSSWCNKCVVFLEIDGILNTRPDQRIISLEKVPCAQLRRLLEASKAEIVLTSRWRKHHEYIAEVLNNFGALPDNWTSELHRAPWNANKERRDLEILQWLNAHRDIAGWVALDARDLLRFPSAARLEGHTIQVDPVQGLTGEVVAAALRALRCNRDVSRSEQRSPSLASASQPSTACGQSPTAVGAESAVDQPSAPCSQAASSLETMGIDLAAGFRAALSWDDDLAGKMEDLLRSLPPGSKDLEFPKSDSSRAEFEAVRTAACEKFKKLPEK